jgi:hypothetical protein
MEKRALASEVKRISSRVYAGGWQNISQLDELLGKIYGAGAAEGFGHRLEACATQFLPIR